MKHYHTPTAEIVTWERKDILTTSDNYENDIFFESPLID